MSGTCRTVANHLRVYSRTIQALYTSIPTFPEFPMQARVPENSESLGHGRNMSGARSIMPYNPLSISHIPLVTSTPYIQNHTLSFNFTTIPWVLGLCLKTQNLGMWSRGSFTQKLGNSDFGPTASGSRDLIILGLRHGTSSPTVQVPEFLIHQMGPTTTPQVQTPTCF